MNIKQLEYFLAIAETGQLTTAAKKLHISQPPLSVQLKALEEELNVELFTRNSRNLHITHDGLLLKDKAEQIFSLIDSIYDDFNNDNYNNPRTIHIGSINISIFNETKTRQIGHGIQKIKEKYPNSTFQIFTGSSVRIKELLDEGTISVGFVRYPLMDHNYTCINLSEQKDYYIALGHARFFSSVQGETISMKELEGIPLIIHNSISHMLHQCCEPYGFLPDIAFRTDYDSFSCELALSQLGVALLPISCINTLLQPVFPMKIFKIVEPEIPSNLYLIAKKQKYLSIVVKEFLDYFQSTMDYDGEA